MTTEQTEAMKAIQDAYLKMNKPLEDPAIEEAFDAAAFKAAMDKTKIKVDMEGSISKEREARAAVIDSGKGYRRTDDKGRARIDAPKPDESAYAADKEFANKYRKPVKEELDEDPAIEEALTGREALAAAAKKKGFGTPEREALLLKQQEEMKARHAKADADYEARYGKKPSVCEESDLEEKVLTAADVKQKEQIVKGMKKKLADFKAKYGDRAQTVMYATATNIAKNQPD
jgi:hypothetical protein